MKLTGRLINGNKILDSYVVVRNEDKNFRNVLEEMLIELCRNLDIQVPIWLDRNTKEFAAFRKTFFIEDQFMEDVKFEKLEIDFEN